MYFIFRVYWSATFKAWVWVYMSHIQLVFLCYFCTVIPFILNVIVTSLWGL